MRFTIRPDDSFYGSFNSAAANLVRGAQMLLDLVLPDADVADIAERLGQLEHDTDRITHDVYNRINTSSVAPFDREDVLRLAHNLDDVMDHIEAAGSLVYLYGLTKLPALPREMHELVAVLEQQARLTSDAMPRLKGMRDLKDYWIECNRLENDGDQAYRMLLVRLFSGEYGPLEVLKMKEVADELEATCDAFEHVANMVEQISVKQS